jgi:hypothetical protein
MQSHNCTKIKTSQVSLRFPIGQRTRPGPPPHTRPKQLLRAFDELKTRMHLGLDREVCLTSIGAFTKAGEAGIGISQIGARVNELCKPELGCKIESILLPGHQFHTYFLHFYPQDIIERIEKYRAKRKPSPKQMCFAKSPAWYTSESGCERPGEPSLGPLFEVSRR